MIFYRNLNRQQVINLLFYKNIMVFNSPRSEGLLPIHTIHTDVNITSDFKNVLCNLFYTLFIFMFVSIYIINFDFS